MFFAVRLQADNNLFLIFFTFFKKIPEKTGNSPLYTDVWLFFYGDEQFRWRGISSVAVVSFAHLVRPGCNSRHLHQLFISQFFYFFQNFEKKRKKCYFTRGSSLIYGKTTNSQMNLFISQR